MRFGSKFRKRGEKKNLTRGDHRRLERGAKETGRVFYGHSSGTFSSTIHNAILGMEGIGDIEALPGALQEIFDHLN